MTTYPDVGITLEGEASAIQSTLQAFVRAGDQIGRVLPSLQSAVETADGWEGSAAEEFKDKGDDLPKGLIDGAESMGKAADALGTWAGQLVNNKLEAEVLDSMAKRLKQLIEQAWDDVREATAAVNAATTAEARNSAQGRLDTAARQLGTLQADLERVIQDGQELQQRHLDQANAAAAKIRAAEGGAFQPVGWFPQAVGVVGTVMGEISTWTGRAAFVAALIPGGGVVAGPLLLTAATTGVASVGGKATAKLGGAPDMQKLGWGELGLDALLSAGGPVTAASRHAFKEGLRQAVKDAREQGLSGVSRNALKEAFDASKAGEAAKVLRDAGSPASLRELAENVGRAKADELAKLGPLERGLQLGGMGTSSILDAGDYASKASGGDGLPEWLKPVGKLPDASGAIGEAVNTGAKKGSNRAEGAGE
jgi:hypothetical protein